MEITINKLQKEDIEETLAMIKAVTFESYLFENKDMGVYADILEEEMQMQKVRLEESLTSNQTQILVAKRDDKIIGSIGFHQIGNSVKEALKRASSEIENITEVVMLYVSPEYQKLGIGSKLFNAIISKLQTTDFEYYAVSTAFNKGKAFWIKTLGEPEVFMEKYYEDTDDCLVWIKKV